MIERGKYPYEDFTVYFPIWHKVEKRYMICLVPIDNKMKRFTMSYARYLLSVKLKRKLKSFETVDHIDGNKINDSLDNLQILSREENTKKYYKDNKISRRKITIVCPICNKKIIKNYNQTSFGKRIKNNNYCSRECFYKKLRKKQ